MRHAMWMGTRGYEMWVPMPKISPAYNRVGYASSSALLSGGVTLRTSKGAHQEYGLEWNNGPRDDIAPIRDMADGLYDSQDGVNLIQWIDPVAADRNLLPAHWATPALGAEDAPSLDRQQRPGTVVQAASQWRLPARAAAFGAVQQSRRLYVPIPPGFVANFGWIGSGTGVTIAAASASGSSGVQSPAALPGTGTVTNAQIARTGGTTGIEVALAAGSTPTIRAMTLQVLPAGRVPRSNVPWSGGRGHSGCQFGDRSGLIPLSAALDLISATTTLIETGDWL